jgi:hypothetical protein
MTIFEEAQNGFGSIAALSQGTRNPLPACRKFVAFQRQLLKTLNRLPFQMSRKFDFFYEYEQTKNSNEKYAFVGVFEIKKSSNENH